MDMLLTARMMNADEAERAGLVSRVVSFEKLMDEALAAAAEAITPSSGPSSCSSRGGSPSPTRRRYPTPWAVERRYSMPSAAPTTSARGMAAFVEKRAPAFRHS